jgi:tripartite-type tricarboxylate transporter receptor subunit TctC
MVMSLRVGQGAPCTSQLSRIAAMRMSRRRFVQLATGAAALPALSRHAWAQTYPARPVRIIAPNAPAGPVDLVARLTGQWLSERLGQPFVVENRPGAGGTIGAEVAVRSVPDGHTLLVASVNDAANATLYDKLNYDFIRDVAAVASVMRTPIVMVVNPSVPAASVPEFIAYAKANPGKINMASAGIGTGTHLAGELFKSMAGVNMIHVPYRGGAPAIIDLIAGQVQVIFVVPNLMVEHVRAGKLRALAVTTAARWQGFPHLPTVGDFVPSYEASAWFGLVAPKNTPVEIVDKLNRDINAALADPKIKARLADAGGTILPGTPADFGKLIADETEKWGRVIRFAGIKPE